MYNIFDMVDQPEFYGDGLGVIKSVLQLLVPAVYKEMYGAIQ